MNANVILINEFFTNKKFILESFEFGEWSGKQMAAIVRVEDVLIRPKTQIISTSPMCPPNALCEVDGLNIDLEFNLPVCADLAALAYRADISKTSHELSLFVDARASINPAVDCSGDKKVQARINLVDAPTNLGIDSIILN